MTDHREDFEIALKDNERLRAENEAWESIARFLFDRLDEIDTADDLAKSDDNLYRSLVRREHARRFEVAETDGYSVTFPAARAALEDTQ